MVAIIFDPTFMEGGLGLQRWVSHSPQALPQGAPRRAAEADQEQPIIAQVGTADLWPKCWESSSEGTRLVGREGVRKGIVGTIEFASWRMGERAFPVAEAARAQTEPWRCKVCAELSLVWRDWSKGAWEVDTFQEESLALLAFQHV